MNNSRLKLIILGLYDAAGSNLQASGTPIALVENWIDELNFQVPLDEKYLVQLRKFLLGEKYIGLFQEVEAKALMGTLPKISDLDFIDDFKYDPESQ